MTERNVPLIPHRLEKHSVFDYIIEKTNLYPSWILKVQVFVKYVQENNKLT